MFHNGNKIKAAILISTFIIFSYIIAGLTSCLGPKEKTTVELPGPQDTPQAVACGSLSVGDTQTKECPAGQVGENIFVCGADGKLAEALNTCKVPDVTCEDFVSFADIKPILTRDCVSCHFTPVPYDDYELAKSKIDSFINRINLGVNNPERMPREPLQPLSIDDRNLFQDWKDDGLKETEDCDSPGEDLGSFDLFEIESAILSDLAKIEQADRKNTRYLITSHKVNMKRGVDDMAQYTAGVAKSLNHLNNELEDLYGADAIDEKKTIYRFDLRTFALTRENWKQLEDTDQLDLESFTDEGETIKFLTGARKAWFHFDNFMEVAFENVDNYYDILEVDIDEEQFLADIGVNRDAQFQDFSAQFMGFVGSEIANDNRMIYRLEGRDGFVWITADVGSNVVSDGVGRNLFSAPCLEGTGCNAIFQFDAGEILWIMPNGLMGAALFDANGIRQDNAPVELAIVFDTRSPRNPEIQNGADCFRCHAAGMIPNQDQVRNHVLANGDQFAAEDRLIILELYKDQSANNAAFQLDNSNYAQKMAEIGVDVTNPDPINHALDEFLLDWNLEEIAGLLLVTPEFLTQCIEGSADASGEIGQLLTGGDITFAELALNIDTLKQDCRLFQEPL